MEPVRTAECNATYGGKGCIDLPARVVDDIVPEIGSEPVRLIKTYWRPTPQERAAIIVGDLIELTCYGGQPAVILTTAEET